MLFATLDPTLRAIELPAGTKAILSDTVGFISDLPTMLIAAFRATLEEVIEADIILHVRDISHADTEAQAQDVNRVLQELGIDAGEEGRIIELWNKIDQLAPEARVRFANSAERQPAERRPVLTSAITGEGLAAVSAAIELRLAHRRLTLELRVPAADGAGMAWLHRNVDVLEKTVGEDGSTMVRIRADRSRAELALRKFPEARQPAVHRRRTGIALFRASSLRSIGRSGAFLRALAVLPQGIHLGEGRLLRGYAASSQRALNGGEPSLKFYVCCPQRRFRVDAEVPREVDD